MNNQLTEDQRRKIEENKQRALQKRAQKASNISSQNVSITNCKAGEKSAFENRLNALEQKHKITPNSYHPYKQKQTLLSKNKSTYSNSSSFYSSGHASGQVHGAAKLTGLPRNPGQLGRVQLMVGKCVMVSNDMFTVEVGYHSALIEFFKQQKTRSYDAATKSWSFKLEHYEEIFKGMKAFQPDVEIEGFPSQVLAAFRSKQKVDEVVPDADLSSVSPSLVNTLMAFQREGVNKAIHWKGRILIADDMGLGKTLQAICIAAYYRKEWPLLVVAPSSVRFDWAQQICKWLPDISRDNVNVVVSGKSSAISGLVNIISYDLVSKKTDELREKNFKVVIMDESHFLKNFKTVRTKAAMPLLNSARRVLLLSGTPALSRPSELYCQINAVIPYLFKFHDFGVRYCDAKKNPWGWDYQGSSNMLELQLLLEKCIMIRRLKKDVLSQLPEKTRQMVVLDPALIQQHKDLKSANKMVTKLKDKGESGRKALLHYFHETSRAKLSAIRQYILDLLESDKKFLVFAHHREMLDAIEDCVKSQTKDISYIRIDGTTSSEQRSFFCKKFQTNEDYRLAILSITAANAGLNLAAASVVVFTELFWNPGILIQAEDRAHRLGQKNCVNVQYLVARGTADDFVWPLIQSKLDVLGKAGLTSDNLSEADTKIMKDPKQQSILEMFSENFIEESTPHQGNEENIADPDVSKESCAKPQQSNTFPKASSCKRQASMASFVTTTPTKKSRSDSVNAHQATGLSEEGLSEATAITVDDTALSQEDLADIEALDWDDQM